MFDKSALVLAYDKIPLLTYRSIARHTVVERLREAE